MIACRMLSALRMVGAPTPSSCRSLLSRSTTAGVIWRSCKCPRAGAGADSRSTRTSFASCVEVVLRVPLPPLRSEIGEQSRAPGRARRALRDGARVGGAPEIERILRGVERLDEPLTGHGIGPSHAIDEVEAPIAAPSLADLDTRDRLQESRVLPSRGQSSTVGDSYGGDLTGTRHRRRRTGHIHELPRRHLPRAPDLHPHVDRLRPDPPASSPLRNLARFEMTGGDRAHHRPGAHPHVSGDLGHGQGTIDHAC